MAQPTPLSHDERRSYALARRSFESGDDERAIENLRELLRTRQGFADVHYMLGVLLERRDEAQAASRAFTAALRINPQYAEARLALASLYEREGDFERCREITQQLRTDPRPAAADSAALDPTTRGKLANLQADLGDAFRQAGELREAIEAYRKALDRCPEFHDIRQRLGIALREAGLPDRALAEFRRIQRVHPGYLEAGVQAGVTLYSLGRSEEALEQWRGVLRHDPAQPEARMYLRLVTPR